jgi:ubiquinone biosynthesis protein UbiJ
MNDSSVILKILLFSLEQGINRALELDRASRLQLESLGQHSLRITIIDWDFTFYVLLLEGEVELLTSSEEEPDCEIRCSLNDLYDLVTVDDNGEVHFHEDAEISGNSELLVRLHHILVSAEPDYEAALARWSGPVIAHKLGQTLRSGVKWADSVRKSVVDDIQLFIHEESGLFPHPLEVEAFYSEISQLQEEVKNLTKAFAKMQPKQSAKDESQKTSDRRGSSSCD